MDYESLGTLPLDGLKQIASEKSIVHSRSIGNAKLAGPVKAYTPEPTEAVPASSLLHLTLGSDLPASGVAPPQPVGNAGLPAVVDRLSKLSQLEYDMFRVVEAKVLGVRTGTLDAAVKTAKKEKVAADTPFDEIEPWPESVDGAELLSALVTTIRRFIICEHHTAVAAALWIVMSWFMDVVGVAPLALITAPEKRCGKLTLPH